MALGVKLGQVLGGLQSSQCLGSSPGEQAAAPQLPDAPQFQNTELRRYLVSCEELVFLVLLLHQQLLAQSPGLAASTLRPSTETMLEAATHSHSSFPLLWHTILANRALLGCFSCCMWLLLKIQLGQWSLTQVAE